MVETLQKPDTEIPLKIQKLLDGIEQQEKEDLEILHLTAYENSLSNTCKRLISSTLSQRYQLGTLESRGSTDPGELGEFLFKGLLHVNEFESAAVDAGCKMFSALKCDFRPLSGMHAMLLSLITLTKPNDVVYSVECDSGGHFATHNVLRSLNRRPAIIPINQAEFNIDLDAFAKAVKMLPPKCLYFDIGCPLFPIPIQKIRDIVGPDVLIIYDASHSFGLIAGDAFQSPLSEGADVLQGNTHKTFPGPQKGMFYFNNETHADALITGLSSGLISSQHTHHSLALYLTLLEMEQFGRSYAKQMLLNAKALAHALSKLGIELLASDLGCTQSNILLIKGNSVGGHVTACRRLYECNIETNSRHAYGEEVIRLGVQEVTRRGMKEAHMEDIASFFKRALFDRQDSSVLKREIALYLQQFSKIAYSFD